MAQQLDPAIFGGPPGKDCRVEGCGKRARKRGLCVGHAWREARGKPMEGPIRPYLVNGGPCSIPRCGRPSRTKGLCIGHYRRRLEGRKDWAQLLRPRRGDTAHLGTPTVRVELLRLLDSEP